MRISVSKIVNFLPLFLAMIVATAHAGAASPSLLQAKKKAEVEGYIFFTTHDEIMVGAKKEGKLRVSTGMGPPTYTPLISAFKQKYPFITDIYVEEISRTEAYQRFILGVKAGQAKEWDIAHIPIDFAREYPPYLKKHDILGMAKQGVLTIDPRMVHPVERNMVSVTSNLTVVPYNSKLISEDKVPAKWEDFLKPEFKGRKFATDVRPLHVAGLVPAWGLERTLDFARKIAAQQPAWGSGVTRMNTAMATGEYSLGLGSSFSAFRRAMSKDPTESLNYKLVEPIPTRIVDHTSALLNTTNHPHAALLWLEFLASPDGQEIVDKYEPLRGSVFTPGTATEKVTRGKKLSVIDWDHFTEFQGYTEKIVGAYGFPKADMK